MKSLAKNSFFNVVYSVLNILFPLITSIYVARILLPTGVGRVSYAQNIASYFVAFASLGLASHGIREISKARDNQLMLNRAFSELIIINFVSTTIAVIAYFIMIGVGKAFFTDTALFIICGFQIVFNYINVDWFYQGKEEYVYIVCRNLTIKILSIVALLLLVKNRGDYKIYAIITVVATGGNYIFNIIHSRKYVQLTISGLQIRKHIKPLFILALTTFFSQIYSKIDTTMLGSMSTAEAIGYYSYAQKIISLSVAVCIAVSAVFLPRLAYYYATDKDSFNELVNKGFRILSFLIFPMMVGLYILAPEVIIVLFSNEFVPAASTIRVLIPLVFLQGFGNLLCYQLVLCTGNEGKRIPAYIAGTLINIILNVLLIPIFQQNGAAIASVFAELMVNGIQFILIMHVLKIPLDKNSFIQGILSSGLMGFSIWFFIGFPLSNEIKLVVGFFVGIIVYFTVNIIMKNTVMEYAIKKLLNKITKNDAFTMK